MEYSKIEKHIIEANISKLKYLSLIALGFSIFTLLIDFVFEGVWPDDYLYFYKVLDIAFAFISVSAVSNFWIFKNKSISLQKAGTILYPFLVLIWSAVVTGIDFSFLGFSTFIIVVLSIAFFLYINLGTAIVYFAGSCLALIATLYFRGELYDNYTPLLFLVIPTIIISTLITARNYKSKLNDLFNSEEMAELNMKLQYSNQNLEREIEKRTKEILVALEKAEESDRLKSAFLANMSHEIRTPMNGILGFAELLKEPDLTGEEQQEYIRIIEKSGTRMLNIINEIVDISRIESGQMKISLSEININEFIELIYTMFKPEAEYKGIKLSYKNALTTTKTIIRTDRDKLNAIFTNLINNAIKYTSKGEIEIGYHVETRHALSLLQFYVKDTGIGIPKDRQEAIFERFIQADISDKMARQGAGLGLAISKAYIEMLGGKIGVESDNGLGSTFYVTLPSQPEMKEEPTTKNEILAVNEDIKLKGLKILIVEDDESSTQLISILSQKYSKEFLKVGTGNEAVETCRDHPDIDLILMDIQMPEMDGYEATRQIREFNQKVIIIAQTAFALSGDREKALEAGCNDYIAKPIKKDELVSLVEKYFKKN